eukprot:gene11670-2405_t
MRASVWRFYDEPAQLPQKRVDANDAAAAGSAAAELRGAFAAACDDVARRCAARTGCE